MKKVLILGGSGLVGSRFIELKNPYFQINAPSSPELDILDSQALEKFISLHPVDVVINFAAFTNVKEAEKEVGDRQGLVYRLNSESVKRLAAFTRQNNIHLIQLSTEYVFDGKKESPYLEEDPTCPINWYGQTKCWAEEFIQEVGGQFSIVRISMPFRSQFLAKKDIARVFLERLQTGQPITAITDSFIAPTFIDDIADALAALIKQQSLGLFHVVPPKPTTPFLFAKLIAETFKLDSSLIQEIDFTSYTKKTPNLFIKNSALSSQKFCRLFPDLLHPLEQTVATMRKQCYI